MKKEKDLTCAKYGEWQLSLFGASFIAFGLGMLFVTYLSKLTWLVIFIGIVMHGIGMYKIHKRNL